MRKRMVVAVILAVQMAVSAFAQTTDFFKLVLTGTPQDVQAAIKHGANVYATNNIGMTPLMWAASNINPEVITTLLKAGAELNAKDKYGWTPLAYAA